MCVINAVSGVINLIISIIFVGIGTSMRDLMSAAWSVSMGLVVAAGLNFDDILTLFVMIVWLDW